VEKKRENIYLPLFLTDKVDNFSKEMGLGKSAAYTVIVKQFFEYQDMLMSMPSLLEVIKKASELEE
jgi:hypothetical protein